MPDLLVQIMGFMVRYLDVVTADLGRQLTAMRSRGFDPRSPRHWPALAAAWARCSSAPTSAASGCTWRCCPAATPGQAARAR